MASHVGAFDFSEEHDGHGGFQNFESLLRGGHDDDGVAVVAQHVAHNVRGFWIRFDDQHDRLRLGVRGSG